jgi:hypothetical protein
MNYEGGMRVGYGQSQFKAIRDRRGTVVAFNGPDRMYRKIISTT